MASTKSSRFSSFKAFGFSMSKDSLKPPPPPPKDPYYLQNRSLVSLVVPESSSSPNSPLSPHDSQNRLMPSSANNPYRNDSSAMSLASSSTSHISSAHDPSNSNQAQKKERGFFSRIGRKSPRSPSMRSDQRSMEGAEDDNISMPIPSSFQHHLHVDERLENLPPSWNVSLEEQGYSPEEIAVIMARRKAGTKSPGLTYVYTERPRTPGAIPILPSSVPTNSPPIIAHPTPRSTSLPRQQSNHSLQSTPPRTITASPAHSQSSSIHSNRTPVKSPPIPGQPGLHSQANSVSSLALTVDTTAYKFAPSGLKPAEPSPAPADISTPIQAPKRTFVVANVSPASPPPSYFSTSTPNGFPADIKDRAAFSTPPKPTAPTHRSTPSVASSASRDVNSTPTKATPRNERRRSKRYNALPPRLSLHKDSSNDLSEWTEALMSAIPSELSSAENTPNSSSFPQVEQTSPPGSYYTTSQPDKSMRTNPSSKPFQSHVSQPSADVRSAGASSISSGRTDWAQHSNVFGTLNDSSGWNDPALGETLSPTLPANHGQQPGAVSKSISPTANNRNSAYRVGDKGFVFNQEPPQSEWNDDDESLIYDHYQEDGSYLTTSGGGNLPDYDHNTSRYSSRSSTSTMTMTPATIVRKVSIVKRAPANVIDRRPPALAPGSLNANGAFKSSDGLLRSPTHAEHQRSKSSGNDSLKPPVSPQSSSFDSEESTSSSSSSQEPDHETPTTEIDHESSLFYYLDSSPGPDDITFNGQQTERQMLVPPVKTAYEDDADILDEEDFEEAEIVNSAPLQPRPLIVIGNVQPSPALSSAITPMTPANRFQGWVATVIRPLEHFIDEAIDPKEHYEDLREIAEGESGSVFCARLVVSNAHQLRLPPHAKARDDSKLAQGLETLVAVKHVQLAPSGSQKLLDLEHEVLVLKDLNHAHVLTMDAMYVDISEDSLWIRMELMERSLADVVCLVEVGLIITDRAIARFTNDILQALAYLQSQRIAHRDLRSDNLLLTSQGFLKLADFSNAVRLPEGTSISFDNVGVPYWQAPEVRMGPYDALKIDVWSLGATIWELAEAQPPFAATEEFMDRWPPLSKPENYHHTFHTFLQQCSEPAGRRPSPTELLKAPFVNNACGRTVIVHLLTQCMTFERRLQEEEEMEDDDS